MADQNMPDYIKDIWDKENITPEDLKLILDYKEYKISPNELRMLIYRYTHEKISDNFSDMKYYEKIMNWFAYMPMSIVYEDNEAILEVYIGYSDALWFKIKNKVLFLVEEGYCYEMGKPTYQAVSIAIELFDTKRKNARDSNLTLPEMLENYKRLANTKSADTIQ